MRRLSFLFVVAWADAITASPAAPHFQLGKQRPLKVKLKLVATPKKRELEDNTCMNLTEKLRKAVELAIAAGHQLNPEAFAFLKLIASTEDPTKVIAKALERIADWGDKPLFIDRAFLEELLAEPEAKKKPIKRPVSAPLKQCEVALSQQQRAVEIATASYPQAKNIDSQIEVLEDPSLKLRTNGTVDDFLKFFRDRFRRIEKMLRQRMDVRNASSIVDALKASPNTKLKVIGMITAKRESKQRTIITLEDTEASVTALVPQNASEELKGKTASLLLDQVVCFDTMKSRTTLLIVEDIILPEISQRTQHKAGERVYAALTSDMHIGNTKFQKESFNRFILWLNGKYGNPLLKEIASRVKYVLVAGDIVDGIGIYPNQVKELAIKDIYKQYRLAAEYIKQIPDYIEVVIIPGNHDAPRKALPQPAISAEYLEILRGIRNVHSLGNPCYLSLHGVEVLMYHGRSLDDVISSVPHMNRNSPEEAMRLLVQIRHLAPMYGGKTTLSSEEKDYLVIDRVPDIFHAGHIHAIGCCNHRGVLIINSGGWQEQTEYMQRLGFVPTPGKVPIVNLQTLETSVISFN